MIPIKIHTCTTLFSFTRCLLEILHLFHYFRHVYCRLNPQDPNDPPSTAQPHPPSASPPALLPSPCSSPLPPQRPRMHTHSPVPAPRHSPRLGRVSMHCTAYKEFWRVQLVVVQTWSFRVRCCKGRCWKTERRAYLDYACLRRSCKTRRRRCVLFSSTWRIGRLRGRRGG